MHGCDIGHSSALLRAILSRPRLDEGPRRGVEARYLLRRAGRRRFPLRGSPLARARPAARRLSNAAMRSDRADQARRPDRLPVRRLCCCRGAGTFPAPSAAGPQRFLRVQVSSAARDQWSRVQYVLRWPRRRQLSAVLRDGQPRSGGGRSCISRPNPAAVDVPGQRRCSSPRQPTRGPATEARA